MTTYLEKLKQLDEEIELYNYQYYAYADDDDFDEAGYWYEQMALAIEEREELVEAGKAKTL